MTYFVGYQEGLRTEDAEPETTRPLDAGGDSLPFDHLDGRRFEVLVYRLKKLVFAEPKHRVALMQGSGERGRDVVVYGAAGGVVELVQCKNTKDRQPDTAVRRELLKVALHAFLEPGILGDGPVRYELWSPAGFTEAAANLIDTWPAEWTEAAVQECAEVVLGKYAAFDELTWSDVKEFVLNRFPQIVGVYRTEGVDIAPVVRANLAIHKWFFEGRIVMDRADVVDTLQELVAAGTSASMARFSDQDAIHVLDRIASFSPNQRLVGSNGYVMGVPIELVSRFRRGEHAEYARCAMQATFGITVVVQNACTRIATEFVEVLRKQITPQNRSLFSVVRRTMIMSMIAKLTNLPMRILGDSQPDLAAYAKLLPEEKLERHVGETWSDLTRSRDGYDPALHPAASDEAMRHKIALHMLNGFATQEEFERTLREDVERFRQAIDSTMRSFMQLVPQEIMVIADTTTVFEKGTLFQRMVETTNELIRLRGSTIIPE